MKALTIRRVDPDLARALERETARRGASLNETVLQLLRERLEVEAAGRGSNGLGALAGQWTEEDLEEFEAATAVFEQVDEELWS